MDEYTQKTKAWLDERFKKCDENGVYYAHQPIYGFRNSHSDPSHIDKYIRTYHIMRALSHLNFDSLLDVGAAEGYKAYLAEKIFQVKVQCCDLSDEACNRAKEIFSIESTPVDIHNLPFSNNEFDVVLCSETLEHVTDSHRAINELLRVARKAVVITIPHEPREVVNKNIAEAKPHAHVHCFALHNFDYLESSGFKIMGRKVFSRLLGIPAVWIEAMAAETRVDSKYHTFWAKIYDATMAIRQNVFGKNAVTLLLRLDICLTKLSPGYHAMLFVILKDTSIYTRHRTTGISASKIVDFAIPYHYLKPNC